MTDPMNETEYIRALINRANEFAGGDEVVKEKKSKTKRQYSDETKAKMVERLRIAREKSLETRKLKAGIRDGIKQETKEQEKTKLMELSAKYSKTAPTANDSTVKMETPSAPQAPAIKPQPAAPTPQQSKVEVEVKQAPAAVSSGPKYFLPTRVFANKHAIKSLF